MSRPFLSRPDVVRALAAYDAARDMGLSDLAARTVAARRGLPDVTVADSLATVGRAIRERQAGRDVLTARGGVL